MIVRYRQSGGMTGGKLDVTVDTDELSGDEAEELVRLLDAADLASLPRFRLPLLPASGFDVFVYAIDVRDSDRRWRVRFDDTQATAEVRPLVAFLAARAMGRQPKGRP